MLSSFSFLSCILASSCSLLLILSRLLIPNGLISIAFVFSAVLSRSLYLRLGQAHGLFAETSSLNKT